MTPGNVRVYNRSSEGQKDYEADYWEILPNGALQLTNKKGVAKHELVAAFAPEQWLYIEATE